MGVEDRETDVRANPRPDGVELVCPECGDAVVVDDIHAFLLGLHQRVCGALESVNGGPE